MQLIFILYFFQCTADSVWLNESEIEQHVLTVEPYMLGPEPVKFITQVRDGGGMLGQISFISRFLKESSLFFKKMQRKVKKVHSQNFTFKKHFPSYCTLMPKIK